MPDDKEAEQFDAASSANVFIKCPTAELEIHANANESQRHSMSRASPAKPLVVIEVAQKICSTPFTSIVRNNAGRGNCQHDYTDSHCQPGLVHSRLPWYGRIATR
ncbi:hypothetical protein AB4Y38_32415 [Paraburkholderia sp. EG285A]|uniref:hypothetical protein n=1 Tax=Paraburkholderia sp. EG285A TaxID=3237009 RepID=UPI0034D2CB62